ncbi:MAG: ABC transporter permease [Chelatococcus sp.]|jgi:ABC-type dipeptide/oligopeptide/nickel transport system permease component|uniref:ABC transporter permease n=1 Tax=unclassified Chelatococcus TaxID=2638111 RepID=UPI001BCF3B97|nr:MULTISPECIES: ABC transporter permease [unclassified Chelatococcus]CAH1662887.1 Ni(2(+)) ABC transporter membrane subunit NikB [Hyphomicrobiales bacterium]MBS7741495.1 ABC transporter permease [Chelatococcus sp. HY11]MBX3540796.1 ABC transporter permease [Chelatococcus sp.]MBX3544486.1 ABC transporter permease [Chelatococcus sp.]MCO5078991.1 ABC transporter permease [Chelatococcus sp.]
MLGYVIRRILYTLPSLFCILMACFLLTRLSGDPVELFLPIDASEEARQAFREQNGLDRPVVEQFFVFTERAMRGDFGNSLRFQEPAVDLLIERLPATLELALATLALSVIIGIPAGIASAYFRNSPLDFTVRGVTAFGQAVPTFYWGILSIIIFSVWLRWLPSTGSGTIWHLILPATTLASTMLALVTRVMRSTLLETIRQDYVRTARAKGLTEMAVLLHHAVRNALIPVVTVVALQFGVLMGGVIVTETVFAWPGVGRLAIQAIYARDYPVVQAVVFFFAVIFVLSNLAADLLHAVLDPRVRLR